MSARAAAPPLSLNIDRENKPIIDDFGTPPSTEEDSQDELHSLLRIGIPLFAVIVGTAVLYFARDILLPLGDGDDAVGHL